ncbi:MAG: helix-turn-helix domain-containing protein [Pseudonocardia sp.]
MDEDGRATFTAELARRRAAEGLPLAALAAVAHVHRAYLHRVETGHRWPTEPVARLLDDALHAHGVLHAAWRAGETARRAAAEDARCLATSVRESERLDVLLDDVPLGEAVTAAEQAAATLAVDYLRQSPAPMLRAALTARTAAVRELDRAPSTGQRRDLIRVAGYLSGVLAYAALDLNHPGAAARHAATAWRCAEATGDRELAAWVRGTQSLIARFDHQFPTALALARDGLDHAGGGSASARLLSGVAQSAANLGDRVEAHRGLNAAEDAADRAGPDAFCGLFTFSRAKLHYYSGSALIWLDQPADARRAAASAGTGITLWQTGDPADRSLKDEALAGVYAATAHVQLDELDAATAMLAPVLALPVERRISWLHRRVARVGDLLTAPRFTGSTAARDLRAEIEAFG